MFFRHEHGQATVHDRDNTFKKAAVLFKLGTDKVRQRSNTQVVMSSCIIVPHRHLTATRLAMTISTLSRKQLFYSN